MRPAIKAVTHRRLIWRGRPRVYSLAALPRRPFHRTPTATKAVVIVAATPTPSIQAKKEEILRQIRQAATDYNSLVDDEKRPGSMKHLILVLENKGSGLWEILIQKYQQNSMS
jgi:Na+-transporting NADH:ubiquinone oxidoreductase subunit NqrC